MLVTFIIADTTGVDQSKVRSVWRKRLSSALQKGNAHMMLEHCSLSRTIDATAWDEVDDWRDTVRDSALVNVHGELITP